MKMARRLSTAVLVSLLCCGVLASQSEKTPDKSQSRHIITFKFDYDFRVTPACSEAVKKDCVQKFNFYDISLGIPKKVALGSLPAPAGATGQVKGILFSTERRLFKSGKHMVAVSAQLENGVESEPQKCSTIVKVR